MRFRPIPREHPGSAVRPTDPHSARHSLRDLREEIDTLSGRLDALQALISRYLEQAAGGDEEKADQRAAAALGQKPRARRDRCLKA